MTKPFRIIGRIVCIALSVVFIAIGLASFMPGKDTVETKIPFQQLSFQDLNTHDASFSAIASASAVLSITPTPVVNPVPPVILGEKTFKVPILLYHYISKNENEQDKVRTGLSTPPQVFDAQLTLLEEHGFTTISLDELAAAFAGSFALPAKPVILTFDDGYQDFYIYAAPVLKKHNMKGINFIPTGLMSGGNYMTWSQIEELSRTPNVIFGAHSVHHYVLPKMNADQLSIEVGDSKKILESHVGYAVNWFCYPYGLFDERVVAAVKNAGYIGSLTTLPGAWQYGSRFFYIPRFRAGTRTGGEFLSLIQ